LISQGILRFDQDALADGAHLDHTRLCEVDTGRDHQPMASGVGWQVHRLANLNRDALKKCSCECHEVVHDFVNRIVKLGKAK